MQWWEIRAKERQYWLRKLGLDGLEAQMEKMADSYDEAWDKANRAEGKVHEISLQVAKDKNETDKKLEQMQKKFEQMEKMEREKRREHELMVARHFHDLQNKVGWLMVQMCGWSPWKPWMPSPPGLL